MKKKSKITAGLLGIFLGTFGVHNFYIGSYGKATAQLLITVLSAGLLAFISLCWGVAEGILILTNCIDINQKYRKEHGTIEENKEFAKESFKKFNKTRSYAIDYVKKHTKLSVEEIKEVENEFDLENQELEKYKQESLKRQQENKNELLQKQGQPEISKQIINTKTEKISTSPTVTNYHYIELDGQLKSSLDILNEVKKDSCNMGYITLDRDKLLSYRQKNMAEFNSREEYNNYIKEFEHQEKVIWKEIVHQLLSKGYISNSKEKMTDEYIDKAQYLSMTNQKIYEEEEFRQAKMKAEEEKAEKERQLKSQKDDKSATIVATLIVCIVLSVILSFALNSILWGIIAAIVVTFLVISGVSNTIVETYKDTQRYKYGDKVDNMTIYEIQRENEKNEIIQNMYKKNNK